MAGNNLKWIYLLLLSLVWGSSFILIKKGLLGLSALQVGSLRIVFAALFLLFIGLKSLRHLRRAYTKWIAITGFFGTFFPAYLFAIAETEIDSAIVSILNSTTPLLAMCLGIFIFRAPFVKRKFVGVMVGLVGATALILSGAAVNPEQNYWFSGFVILASLFYGYSSNIVKSHFQEVPALAITTGNFMMIGIPALIVLITTGFFSGQVLSAPQVPFSLLCVAILGIVGTGMALIIFNKLIQISDPVFSTSVTYIVPIVALGWGILDGEEFSLLQIISGSIIILGVLIVNKNLKKP